MKKNPTLPILLCLVMATVSATVLAQNDEILPSVAAKEITAHMRSLTGSKTITSNDQYNAKQKELALEYLAKVRQHDLVRSEQVALAGLLRQAGRTDEAHAMYEKLVAGDDTPAALAARELINEWAHENFMGVDDSKKDPAAYEKLIADFRTRFGDSLDDNYGISPHVDVLAGYFVEHKKPGDAVRVLDAEFASLNYDKPGYSFKLLGIYEPYVALGRKAEAEERMRKGIAKLEETIEQRNAVRPKDAEKNGEYDMLTFFYSGIVQNLKATLGEMNLMGAPAPGFDLTHFFNTTPFDFAEKTKGKVVFLDFFANWCKPCIATFPEMREFYAEYAPKGVIVLGVTGFQGSMVNHGADRVTDLSKEEEAELMKQFISHQNVTWPVVFSDRNCFDPEYGVRGVPTVVIIDKQGRVRLSTNPNPNNQEEIKALVDKLLKE